jgi:hypothetical protein
MVSVRNVDILIESPWYNVYTYLPKYHLKFDYNNSNYIIKSLMYRIGFTRKLVLRL